MFDTFKQILKNHAIRKKIDELRMSIRYVTFADEFDDGQRAQYILNILKQIRRLESELK